MLEPSSVRNACCACLLLLGLALGAAAPIAEAQSVSTNDYNHWVIAEWRWRLALPARASSPGSCITRSQRGPVWFLSSSDTGSSLSVSCALPAGRSIMLNAPSVECLAVGPSAFRAGAGALLRRCAQSQWQRHAGWLTVTVDGVALHPAGYIIATDPFTFRQPARNNVSHKPGSTRGQAAVYGSASILSPLSPGTHTLVEQLAYSHTPVTTRVVYHLTVG